MNASERDYYAIMGIQRDADHDLYRRLAAVRAAAGGAS
jgi:hypothetical protein